MCLGLALISLTARSQAPARLFISSEPPDGVVTIDGELRGLAPRVEHLAPGVHTVTVERAGQVRSITVSLVADDRRSLRVTFSTQPAEREFPTAGVATALGGAVVLTAGLLLRFQAEADARTIERFFRAGGVWDERTDAIQRSGQAAQTWSWILTATGGLTFLAGVMVSALQLFDRSPSPPRLTVVPLRDGALLSWSATW